ncbi:hypothetical protein [Diaphorobacter aerolatus]|uniref:Uncharacterized protein n=1 Tax=Diaphorobacter aerolatus TaxID=1288495 RepID=A0A7H0GGX5_9BURK|nr:hypothetical protein [Diaphorobacter aerolatus]QNP47541.1 hypothetical protein H9K75_14950 [Diaphorobacter aerolatus]
MRKNDLKKRWEIFNHSDEIFRKTEGFKKSPFGLTTQGLVDFRGISLSSTPLVMGGGWENSTHETDIFDVDFSGGVGPDLT